MTLALAVVGLADVGRGLREAFFMFWETLWPLVLGFCLSGIVQAFVSRRAVERALGNHRPAAVTRASGFGMASSSCSYAAAAMAKTLFAKGADFTTAMVFMFASTNLVIELGIVLLVLLGWQFALGELFGGVVMIVLLALLGTLFLGGRAVSKARRRVVEANGPTTDTVPAGAEEDAGGTPHRSWSGRLRHRGSWADAATYTVSDLTMLRKELVIGYVVAGFLAALVPVHVWSTVFLHGHGLWTTLENVAVGPLVAVVSFVCSVGNVPLAAALWQGGISFGGVVSFIFADLITLPLVLIYRRYYGTRLALRMLAVFWSVMVLAGLVTEGVFRAAGLVPAPRPVQAPTAHFQWNYTSWLDLVSLALFALVYWTYRHRHQLGGGAGRALDPVCGMQVETAAAAASTTYAGHRWYFCSDQCLARFRENPDRWAPDVQTKAARTS